MGRASVSKRKPSGAEQVQYGTLPFREAADGSLRLLLITSRETRRWVVPKGWPMKGRKPHEAAAREAHEEAGIRGKPDRKPIGEYRYWKRGESSFGLCRVEVFPMLVDRVERKWPEQAERQREWFEPEAAALLVEEPGLQALITAFAASRPPRPQD